MGTLLDSVFTHSLYLPDAEKFLPGGARFYIIFSVKTDFLPRDAEKKPSPRRKAHKSAESGLLERVTRTARSWRRKFRPRRFRPIGRGVRGPRLRAVARPTSVRRSGADRPG